MVWGRGPLIGMLQLLKRIRDLNVTLKGDLEFVNTWKFFTDGAFFSTITCPFFGLLKE